MNTGENSFQNTESCCKTKGDYLLLVLLIRTKISGFLSQERFTGIDSPMVRAETPWSRSCREGTVWCFLKNMVRQVWWEGTLGRTLILWCPFQPHPWHYIVLHPASLFFPILFFFFPLPSIASLLFSLSLARPENGVISWAEAMLAANCPCNRREPVGRSKSEEARCCLKPVIWANIHWLRAWAVHVSCPQHQAETSVVFHPLGRACHGCHKSSANLKS